ncbi:hypothetical protein GCM10009765_35050 [Fodinicola feengrottensis]|uniref:Uncharacterized protein n=1 Tax=Fodinicola feengrottensis TaxID=435914 RepID=A0ABN2H6M8_9ACTN
MSHTDGVRPSASLAPSIWYADVATPQSKSAGRRPGPLAVTVALNRASSRRDAGKCEWVNRLSQVSETLD